MHLCICVHCGWYRGWHFDDSWDGTAIPLIFSPLWNFIPQNIQNSIATKMMPKMQTMMCWWWYCGLSIKNIIFYHPGFPHPVIFSLQWPYTRKSRFQFAPILQTFAGFWISLYFEEVAHLKWEKAKRVKSGGSCQESFFKPDQVKLGYCFTFWLFIYLFIYLFWTLMLFSTSFS